jgi:glycosyltransferase involved in cell wall biosynthesis
MKILHLGATVNGGAGIGMSRYHEALLSVGCNSRLLVAQGSSVESIPHVATVRQQYARGWKRIARAAGISTPPEVLMGRRVAEADAAVPQANYELFSLPFSSYPVEDHPWVAEADVVCLHFVGGFLDWPRFFRRVAKPVVIFLHDQQPYLGGFHYEWDAERNPHLQALENEVRRIKQAALDDLCVGVVANSAWNVQAAQRCAFFKAEVPTETIYYPLDTSVFHPRPREAAKLAFGIDPSRKTVGFAAAELSNDRKGFGELLDALHLLPAETSQHLTLVSFGRDPDAARRSQCPLPWVHLGSLDTDTAKVAAYSAMDVFVVPSKAEAFGLTAQEALACGCRVVATRVGGLPEALGEFGVYAQTGGPAQIADALSAALDLAQADGNAAKDWIRKRFEPNKTGSRLTELLQLATSKH